MDSLTISLAPAINHRPGQPKEVLDNPSTILGEEVLPDFVFSLGEIWWD